MRTVPRASVWLSALGVAALQVVGSFGAVDSQPERRALDVLAVVLLLIGPAALAVRDRWPVAAVAVSIAAVVVYIGRGHPYGPIFVSVIVALYSAVQAGHRRSAWLLAGVGYGALALAHLVDPRAEGFEWSHWGLVAGWLLVVLAVSEVVRMQREQAESRERAAVEERERRRGEQRLNLARELHDVLAHNISLINVQASAALHLLDEQPQRVRPALTSIKEASHDALQELRTALDTLRRGEAAPRTPSPRLADLDSLVDGVRASGLDVHVDHATPPAPLSSSVELAAYRIVQEALTNVTRHARARAVTVRVAYDDGVNIEVTDDGVGGDAPEGKGISGMRERAVAVGGTLEAASLDGGGFRVAARLPVRS
jgi:signal transduction histidine kinase